MNETRKLKVSQIHVVPRAGGGENMIIESDDGGTLFEDIKITGHGFGGTPDGGLVRDRAIPVMIHFADPEAEE